MQELIYGLIILMLPLAIVSVFLIKWRRDFERTKTLLVLNPKKFKLQLLFGIPFLIFSILVIYVALHSPEIIEGSIQDIKNWNPYGWYG